MATEKPKPFLTAIKDEINGFFAEAFDRLADGENPADVLKDTSKKTWGVVEVRLKESYRNGQLASKNGKHAAAAATDPEAPAANPFRK